MFSPFPVSGVQGSSRPEEVPSPDDGKALNPLVGVLVGAVGVFIVIIIVAVFVTRRHCTRVQRSAPDLFAGQGK